MDSDIIFPLSVSFLLRFACKFIVFSFNFQELVTFYGFIKSRASTKSRLILTLRYKRDRPADPAIYSYLRTYS